MMPSSHGYLFSRLCPATLKITCLAMDIIYVGEGNTKPMIALWYE